MKRKYKRKSQIKPPEIKTIKGLPWISIHRDNIIETNNMSLLQKYLRRIYSEELETHTSSNEQLNEMISAHNRCFQFYVKNEGRLNRGEERPVEQLRKLAETFYAICKDNWKSAAEAFDLEITDTIEANVEKGVFSEARHYINSIPPNPLEIDEGVSRMHWLIVELIMLEQGSKSKLDLLKNKKR